MLNLGSLTHLLWCLSKVLLLHTLHVCGSGCAKKSRLLICTVASVSKVYDDQDCIFCVTKSCALYTLSYCYLNQYHYLNQSEVTIMTDAQREAIRVPRISTNIESTYILPVQCIITQLNEYFTSCDIQIIQCIAVKLQYDYGIILRCTLVFLVYKLCPHVKLCIFIHQSNNSWDVVCRSCCVYDNERSTLCVT